MLETVLKDKCQDFDLCHGSDYPPIKDADVFVFCDGAMRDAYGNFQEDPESKEAVTRKIWYWKTRRQNLTREFNDLRHELSHDQNVRKDDLARLKRLKEEISDCQSHILEAVWEKKLYPFRSRKHAIKQLEDAVASNAQHLRSQKNHLTLLRHQLGSRPDDEELMAEVKTLAKQVQEAEFEHGRYYEQTKREINDLKKMPYREFLKLRRKEDEQREVQDAMHHRIKLDEYSSRDYAEYREELNGLEVQQDMDEYERAKEYANLGKM